MLHFEATVVMNFVHMHSHEIDILNSHDLLLSDLVAQSVKHRVQTGSIMSNE